MRDGGGEGAISPEYWNDERQLVLVIRDLHVRANTSSHACRRPRKQPRDNTATGRRAVLSETVNCELRAE